MHAYAHSYSIIEHSNQVFFSQFCVIKHLVIFFKKLAKLVEFTLEKQKIPDLCGKRNARFVGKKKNCL
jgi:hypothetical protein